jgi:hypothetical protein
MGLGPGLDPQPRDLAQQLAVPLDELERWRVGSGLDRRMLREHVLQKADPGLANAGLAIRQADEMRSGRRRQGAEHGLGVRQRNAADEVHDRMLAAVRAHGWPPLLSDSE